MATFKIDPSDTHLWEKYSPERFPVMTWKSTPRDPLGKDTGSIYVLPRTPEGLVKIGYRGIKVTTWSILELLQGTKPSAVHQFPTSPRRHAVYSGWPVVGATPSKGMSFNPRARCVCHSTVCLDLSAGIRPGSLLLNQAMLVYRLLGQFFCGSCRRFLLVKPLSH